MRLEPDRAVPPGLSAPESSAPTPTERPGVLVPRAEFGPFDPISDVAHELYIEGFARQAVDVCRQWVCLTDAAGDLTTSRYLRYIEAISLQELGRHAEASAVATVLAAGLGKDLEPVWRAKALSVIAEASARLGEHGRAIAAMAEADWLVRSVPPGSYGHLSASMAVALALRSVNLLEQADAILSAIDGGGNPAVDVLVVQELALLSAYWGTSLWLIGDDAEATPHFADTVTRARRMQRLARAVGNDAMEARGEVIEAYGTMHLGEPALATARALGAAERFTARPELVETHLLHLVLGQAAAADADFEVARGHLEALIEDAETAGREMWAATGMATLGDVEAMETGRHAGLDLWRNVARAALARAWSEREGRFAALRDRNHLRQLTAETDRINREMLQDPLTGLGNRRLLESALTGSTQLASAVFVDIDHFKDVNDTYSHAVGDVVLLAIAEILRDESRQGDVLVRFGGDEFLILPRGGADAATSVAARVHRAVEERRWGDIAGGLTVTVSIGVGHASPEVDDPLAAADAALIAAKRAGRDRVVDGPT